MLAVVTVLERRGTRIVAGWERRLARVVLAVGQLERLADRGIRPVLRVGRQVVVFVLEQAAIGGQGVGECCEGCGTGSAGKKTKRGKQS